MDNEANMAILIGILRDIAENLRRIAFEIENLHNEEDKQDEAV